MSVCLHKNIFQMHKCKYPESDTTKYTALTMNSPTNITIMEILCAHSTTYKSVDTLLPCSTRLTGFSDNPNIEMCHTDQQHNIKAIGLLFLESILTLFYFTFIQINWICCLWKNMLKLAGEITDIKMQNQTSLLLYTVAHIHLR